MSRLFLVLVVLFWTKNGDCKRQSSKIIQTEKIAYSFDPTYFRDQVESVNNPGTPQATLDLNTTTLKTIDQSLMVKVTIILRQATRNMQIGRPIIAKACDFVENDNIIGIYPSLKKNGKFPERCPIPPMEVTLKNYDFDFNLPPFIPEGSFHIIVEFTVHKKIINVFEWYGRILSA